MNTKKKMDRRDFLKMTAAVGGTAALGPVIAGCQPQATPETVEVETVVEKVITATPTPPVNIITQPWVISLLGADDAALRYNNDPIYNPDGVVVNMADGQSDWQTKAIELSRRNEIPWDAYLWAPTWIYGYQLYKAGALEPLDEYIAASKVPDADKLADPGFYAADSIWPAGYFDGRPYQIPALAYSSAVAYYVDMLQEVGYDKPPETWDEFTACAHKLKKAYAADDIVPIAFSPDWLRSPGSIHATFTDQPYDDTPEQLTKIDDPAMWDAMDMMVGWFKDGLCSFEMVTATEPISQFWERKRSAMAIEAHRWVRAGQQIHGVWACQGQNLPVPNAGDPPRTWMTVDGSIVFKNAKNPQKAVDFLLACTGPEGAASDRYYQGGLASEGCPLHLSTFDRLVPEDSPDYWVRQTYEAMNNSVPAPLTGSQNIMLFHFRPYLESMLKGEVTVKEGCKKAQEEIRALVQKFQKDAGEGEIDVHN